MTSQRWAEPWVRPAGTAPERPPGEPGPAQLVLLHLGVLFGLTTLGGLARLVVGSSTRGAVVGAAVLWLLTGTAGWLVVRAPGALEAWTGDLLLTAAGGYLFAAVALGCDDAGLSSPAGTLAGALAALAWTLPAYARHRRLWLQVAVVAAATAALLSGLALQRAVPDAVSGTYLVVLGGFLALGALSGVARPVRSAAVLAALLGTAGSHVLVASHAAGGTAVALLLLAAVATAVVVSGNRSLLPVTLVAGLVLLPSVLEPVLGLGRAVGVALAAVAAGVAWLAADLARRATRPPQVGGVFAACLLGLLVSYPFLLFHTGHDRLADLAHVTTVVAFFAAVAAARRRPATVVSGLLLVAELPGAVDPGDHPAVRSLVGLAGLLVVVALAIALGRRGPVPVAAAQHQDVALSGPGREWSVVSPYAQVFDTVVAILGGAGVPLQLVDRASGRVVAGDALQPLLVVAVWADDPVRTRVRAVGASWDVDRLEADVAERLGNGVAAPR